MQNQDYSDHYRALRIDPNKPGLEYKDIRKAYKLEIQKWHPDRFEDGSAQHKAANTKIKRLNHAFKMLQKYHKEHNSLPIITLQSHTYANTTNRNGNNNLNRSQETTSNCDLELPSYKQHSIKSIFIVLSIIIICYIMITHEQQYKIPHNNLHQSPKQSIHDPSSKAATTNAKNPGLPLKSDSHEIAQPESHHGESTSFFTYGSTVGEVIDIQGIPNKIEGDTWHYGQSRVYFRKGIVIHWERGNDSILKATALLEKTSN
ncbi:MAG: J domain-containing protein [Gammaproteobacteria bacterium]|nr:J domain-containing protein [Gammaproteobacteria bacterium]